MKTKLKANLRLNKLSRVGGGGGGGGWLEQLGIRLSQLPTKLKLKLKLKLSLAKLQFRHFYMLGNYVKLQTFFNPENRLPKHFNSSHVFEKSGPGPFLV